MIEKIYCHTAWVFLNSLAANRPDISDSPSVHYRVVLFTKVTKASTNEDTLPFLQMQNEPQKKQGHALNA